MLYITNSNHNNYIRSKALSLKARYHYYDDCELLNAPFEDDELHIPNSGVASIEESELSNLIEKGFKECSNCKMLKKMYKIKQILEDIEKEVLYNPNRLSRDQLVQKVIETFREHKIPFEDELEFIIKYRNRL